MNKKILEESNLIDSFPNIPIKINKVGVSDCKFPFKIKDPFTNAESDKLTSCKIFLPTSSQKRGIHISRVYESLMKFADETHESRLSRLAYKICTDLIEKLETEGGEVNLQSSLQKKGKSPITQKSQFLNFSWFGSYISSQNNSEFIEGISGTIITTCPCTLAYGEAHRRHYLKRISPEKEKNKTSLLTPSHSQRGSLSVKISTSASPRFSVKDLLEIISDTCILTHDLLKRPDEYDVVSRSFNNPMLSEDVVRSVAFKCADLPLNSLDLITVSLIMKDSIHDFNIFAEIANTTEKFQELKQSTEVRFTQKVVK